MRTTNLRAVTVELCCAGKNASQSRVGSVAARSFGNLGEAPPLQVEKVWKFRPKFRQMISSVVRIAAKTRHSTHRKSAAPFVRDRCWPTHGLKRIGLRQRVRVGAVCVFCKGEIT
jgi:hypothetical protein